MSRFRGGGGAISETRFHGTTGSPTTSAPNGVISFNIYNDAYMQLDRPGGRNWVKIQSGLQPGIMVHALDMPSSAMRPVDIKINGTSLVDQATATNIPADPNDLIQLNDYSTSNQGAGFKRTTFATGDDAKARFTSCFINVGGPFRIVKMGFYVADGNGAVLQGKFGIYQAANHYNENAMPWKIYPKATLSIAQNAGAGTGVNTKFTCVWDAKSQPPVINAEKFYVKSYFNITTGAPTLLTRYALDMATNYKGDRYLDGSSDKYDGFNASSYANPAWDNVYDYTGAVGTSDAATGRSSLLYWFVVERV